jgi:predicted Zn-ribbon and HTH transcriptional regulator
MSYIPPKCIECGGVLNRISNVNPNLKCIECKRILELRVKTC